MVITSKIKSIKRVVNNDAVYDITVADNHNLFASYGKSELTKFKVLVHNCLDENYKFTQKLYRGGSWENEGFKPYSLEFVEYRYGIFRPTDMTIGKSDRANMAKFSLKEIAEYGGFDTCFDASTYLYTEIGRINIVDFIALDQKPRVLSFNHVRGQSEYKNVLMTSSHTNTKRMVEIVYDGGTIRVTEDHEVWSNTRNAYVKAADLLPEEDIEVVTNEC